MFKRIQQSPPGEVESPLIESTSKGILNGRALSNIEGSKRIKIELTVTIAGISSQQLSTNSSKVFTPIQQ